MLWRWRRGVGDYALAGDRGRNTTRDTPAPNPDGPSVAHPVLISDVQRQSEHQERGGALAVEEATYGQRRVLAIVNGVEHHSLHAKAPQFIVKDNQPAAAYIDFSNVPGFGEDV